MLDGRDSFFGTRLPFTFITTEFLSKSQTLEASLHSNSTLNGVKMLNIRQKHHGLSV